MEGSKEIESQVCSAGGRSDYAETSNQETPGRIVVTSRFLEREKEREREITSWTRYESTNAPTAYETRWEDLWWWVYSTSPIHF